MKRITLTNENGAEYSARIMTTDELFRAWEIYKPSTTFYAWLDKLVDANIITQRELDRPDYIVLDFMGI